MTYVTFLFQFRIYFVNEKLIIQIINIKNKFALKSVLSRYPSVSQQEFIPEMVIEFRNSSNELISILSPIINNISKIKLISDNSTNDKILIVRSVNEVTSLIDSLSNCESNSITTDLEVKINNYLNFSRKTYQLGTKNFTFSEPLIMGILNVTPDSFSDGGKYNDTSKAIDHASAMIDAGADIIDIGGESTRPGADEVSLSEELKRVVPVIEGIRKNNKDIILSIDTTKSQTAQAALELGVDIINDVSGLTFDEKIAELATDNNAALVIMHIKDNPRTMQVNPSYNDVVAEIYDHLFLQTQKAKKAGVKNLIIDPGIGFGKTVENNFELLSRIEDLKSLGYPVLIGVSRKSFLGKTLDLEVFERDVPTVITETISLMKGASIIRTHNVKYANQLKTIFKKLN